MIYYKGKAHSNVAYFYPEVTQTHDSKRMDRSKFELHQPHQLNLELLEQTNRLGGGGAVAEWPRANASERNEDQKILGSVTGQSNLYNEGLKR